MRPLLQPLIHKILLIMRRTTSENYPKPPWSKNVADTLTSKKGSPPYPLIGSWTVTNQSLSDVKLTNLKQDSYQLLPNLQKTIPVNIV